MYGKGDISFIELMFDDPETAARILAQNPELCRNYLQLPDGSVEKGFNGKTVEDALAPEFVDPIGGLQTGYKNISKLTAG